MNLSPINQTKLFSLDNYLLEFVELYKIKRLPTKILLSGDKGLGKSTLAFHLVNYILSINEEDPYIVKEFKINPENKSYKLAVNGSNPNLLLVDTLTEKKNIDINQIRELIKNLNKSSFNNKEKFIIIDNIEALNISSINALLKILEEPPSNCLFLIISHNIGMILDTIKSRCLELRFKNLSNEIMIDRIKLLKPGILKNELDSLIINANGSFGRLENLLHSDSLKISDTINNFFEKEDFNENIYDFSNFILQDGIGVNKFDIFTEILNFKLNSYIKEKAIYNPDFITTNNKIFIIRDSILELISQERVYKLNKKQTILSIISNLKKITKLQKH